MLTVEQCPFCGKDAQQITRFTEAEEVGYLAARCPEHTHWITVEQWNRRVAPPLSAERALTKEMIRSKMFQMFLGQKFWHAHHVDLIWRYNGEDVHEEADWLKDVWYALRERQPAIDDEMNTLMKFYSVNSIRELVSAQMHHIEKLQAKLPALRDEQPRNPRGG